MQIDALDLDSIRVVKERVFSSPVYDWIETSDPWRVVREMLQRLLAWFDEFSREHAVARVVLLVTAIAVTVLILAHLGWVLYAAMRSRVVSTGRVLETAAFRRDERWYLEEASRMSREGRFAEAIAARFHALVLRLEQRRALRFHPSKTPA